MFVAALGIALRLRQYLFNRSLWLDEAMLAQSFVHRTLFQLLIGPLENGQSAPPGFLFAAQALSAPFGATDWALRLAPLVMGLGTVVLAVILARREFVSPAAKVAFVGLVSLSPVLIYYSSEFKQYAGDALCSLALLTALAYRDDRRGPWFVAIAGALAFVFSLPLILVAVPAAVLLIVEWGRARRWRALCGVAVAWGLGFALHVVYINNSSSPRDSLVDFWRPYFAPFPPSSVADLLWYPKAFGGLAYLAFQMTGTARPELVPWSFEPPTIALTVVFLGAVIVCAATGRRLGLVAIGTLGLALVASMMLIYPFSTRLLIYFLPLFFLIFAVAIDRIAKASNVAAVAFASVLLWTAFVHAAGVGLVPIARPDIRAMLERIRPEIGDDGAIGIGGLSEPQYTFYAPYVGFGAVTYFNPKQDTAAAGAEIVAAMRQAHLTKLWFVMALFPNESDQIIAEVAKVAPIAQDWDSDGVRAVQFDFSDPHWPADNVDSPASPIDTPAKT